VEPDVEKRIGELEIAMDRLRSLYDQYFLGIEKLEPLVARKDVDRRIYTLRKEQIRNTAQRFRFNMLIQRFNTYQTHWRGICRAIEDGTFKRHILRARARFGPGKADASKGAASRATPSLAETIAEELAALDREFAPKPVWIERPADGDFRLDSEPPSMTGLAASGASARVHDRETTAKMEARVRDLARGLQPAFRQGSNRPQPLGAGSQPPVRPKSSFPRSTRPPPVAVPTPRAATGRPDGTSPAPPGRGQHLDATSPAPPRLGQHLAAAKTMVQPPPRVTAKKAAHSTAQGDGLPEARVRAIYAEYIEAKRHRKESTASITYEALANRLRESGAKLEQKHGRPIDFEVNEKDGKTILKAILK
jgi:hypothetical protein